MNVKLNENFGRVAESYLFSDIAKKVKAYSAAHPEKKIIRLGIGDVTLPLAPAVISAMQKATAEMGEKETFRGYAPEYGYAFLREAIRRHYENFGVCLSDDEIYASDGAKCDCGNIVELFGDNEVLIPDPVYPVYLDSNVMSGRRVRLIETGPENGFLPSPDGLDGLDSKGYVIYLCSPNNPTGATFTAEGLKKWVDFARESGSLIIYDSAYEAFIFDDHPRSIFEIEGAKECAVEICSLSKSAGFTGTRCGWTVIPRGISSGGTYLYKMWERRQATKYNGIPYVVQRAAEAALSPEGEAQCRENVKYYLRNAKTVAAMLDEKGIFYTGGSSSPYVWMKCPGGMTSWEFFDFLLDRANVVGTPGAGFGRCGEGYFRLTGFGSAEATAEAVDRISKII
ncbi:MAG: LL-diaminopimelate aminotransferase [Clostridia bacterium]|nr:LL-diaminopimelate aminotransferase [Clostridia bacterium]